MEIDWSEGAVADLQSIYEYIARDSEMYAERMVDRLYDSATKLAEFPDSGRQIPEFSDSRLREIIVGPYRLMYRRGPECVAVVTILHSSQDATQHIEPADF